MVAGWRGRMGGRLSEGTDHPGHHTPAPASWNPSSTPSLEERAVSPAGWLEGCPLNPPSARLGLRGVASLGGRGGCEIDRRKEQRPRETRIETDRAWAAERCPHPQLFLAPVNPPPNPEGTSPLLLPGTPPTGASCDASDLADPGSSVGLPVP